MSRQEDTKRRPSREQKDAARIKWESTPATFADIGAEIGVSDTAVRKWASAEGWMKAGSLRSVNERAHIKADEGSSEEVRPKFGAEPVKAPTTASVDAAVDMRSKVLQIHRAEWRKHSGLYPLDCIKADFDEGRKAKISAEMLLIRQRGERAAWGLEDGGKEQPSVTVNTVIKNQHTASDDELLRIAAGR